MQKYKYISGQKKPKQKMNTTEQSLTEQKNNTRHITENSKTEQNITKYNKILEIEQIITEYNRIEQKKTEQQQKQSWNRLNTFTKTETELLYRKET